MISNFSLKERNTFGFDSQAELADEITSADQLPALVQYIQEKQLAWRILGGGSNAILPAQLPGITLLMNILGQEITNSDETHTYLAVGAGVQWHAFVRWTIEQDFPGLENLALIPGTVGAAPIQNIGAYGVEVGQYIDAVQAFDIQTQAFVTLTQEACRFAYRDSYFKHHPQRLIVTKVVFKLPKAWTPQLQYAELANHLSASTLAPSPQNIFAAVCAIRKQKLPDPKDLGNVGSFFHNPIVSNAQYQSIAAQFPGLVSYPDAEGKRKLAAGWLIDQCGFKGQRFGAVGVYEKQALVLVNHSNGTAQAILHLAKQIENAVLDKFGVQLQIEPTIF